SINVGNIIVSYATLYRSSEMEYFLTKPIPHTNLFLIKFLDNFFYSSTAFFLMAMAVLLGYGSHFHMPALFYIRTMFLTLMPFIFLSGCLAAIMLMVVMRFAESLGVRKVVVLVVIVFLGVLLIFFVLTS